MEDYAQATFLDEKLPKFSKICRVEVIMIWNYGPAKKVHIHI